MSRRKSIRRPRVEPAEIIGLTAAALLLGQQHSDEYRKKAESQGTRFRKWLATLDLTVDELRAASTTSRHGSPVMPATVVACWINDIAESGGTQRHTAQCAKLQLNHLTLWLGTNGWDTSALVASAGTGAALRTVVDNLWSARAIQPVRQARPVTPEDLDQLVSVTQTNPWGWAELAVEVTVTWLITAWAMSLRGGEAVTRLRWKMVDLATERLVLPGGAVFKRQRDGVALAIPHRGCSVESCHPRCPVRVLHEWRRRCEQYGIPINSEAFVFPPIRRYPVEHTGWGRGAGPMTVRFGERLFIADPIADYRRHRPDLPDFMVRSRAERHWVGEYSRRWNNVAKEAGFSPEHQWQSTGTHGVRRGSASTAADNGVSVHVIALRLRQHDLGVTSRYITRALPDTTRLIRAPASTGSVTEFDAKLLTEPVEPGRLGCAVMHRGVRCGRLASGHITVDGCRIAACSAHYQRSYAGLTGDALTRPIVERRPANITGCQLSHNGIPCPSTQRLYSTDIEGETLWLCHAHHQRAMAGACGAQLTRPVIRRMNGEVQSCEVTHTDVACLNRPQYDITVDGTPIFVCHLHYNRWKAGKTGHDFTVPAKSGASLGSSPRV